MFPITVMAVGPADSKDLRLPSKQINSQAYRTLPGMYRILIQFTYFPGHRLSFTTYLQILRILEETIIIASFRVS